MLLLIVEWGIENREYPLCCSQGWLYQQHFLHCRCRKYCLKLSNWGPTLVTSASIKNRSISANCIFAFLTFFFVKTLVLNVTSMLELALIVPKRSASYKLSLSPRIGHTRPSIPMQIDCKILSGSPGGRHEEDRFSNTSRDVKYHLELLTLWHGVVCIFEYILKHKKCWGISK